MVACVKLKKNAFMEGKRGELGLKGVRFLFGLACHFRASLTNQNILLKFTDKHHVTPA